MAKTHSSTLCIAWLHGYDPKEIALLIADLGLQVSGSMMSIPTKETVAQIADTELILGNKRVVGGFGSSSSI